MTNKWVPVETGGHSPPVYVQLSQSDVPTVTEILSWLNAFQTCVQSAFHMIPNHVYSFLRSNGYLDIEHDITEKGRMLMQKGQL